MSEIPKGYKQTEIGIIPEDWKIESIEENFNISGGYTSSRDQLSFYKQYYYLHYGDIHSNKTTYLDLDKDYMYIPKINIKLSQISKNSFLRDGDLVFVDASEDEIGASKYVLIKNPRNKIFISGLHTIVLKSKNIKLDTEFKKYLFKQNSIISQFRNYIVGTKVYSISKSNIKKIKFYVPPLGEQKAIAEVLSDIDNLIDATEKLMEKKKLIKKGAMQNLLASKVRLAGFSGKWKYDSDVFNFYKGTQRKSFLVSNLYRYPVYNGGQSNSGFTNEFNCRDSIIISEGGNSCGFVNYVAGKFWASGHCYVVESRNFNKKYIYQLLKF